MQVSFIDTTSNPLSAISGTVTSATWISGNSTLVVISATTQQTIVIGLQGKPSDTLNLTDIFAHGLGKYPSDIQNWIDTLTKGAGKPLTDILNLTDLIRKGTGKPLTDILNLSDTILGLRNITLSIGGTELNLSDFISKGVGKFSTDVSNLMDNLTRLRAVPLIISDTSVMTDLLTRLRNIPESFTDTLTLTETLSRQQSRFFMLTDMLTITDNLSAVFHPSGGAVISVSVQDMLNLSDLLAALHVPVGVTNLGSGLFTTSVPIGTLLTIQLAAIPRIATLDYLTAYPLSIQTFLWTPTTIIQIVATGTNGNNAKQTINLWYNVTGAQTLTTPKEQHVLNSGVPTTFSSWIPVTKTGTYTIVPQAEGTNTATLPTQTVTVGWLDLYLVSIILWLTIATPIVIITYMAANTIRTRREEARRKENEPPEE
jgi:hypothetical protein